MVCKLSSSSHDIMMTKRTSYASHEKDLEAACQCRALSKRKSWKIDEFACDSSLIALESTAKLGLWLPIERQIGL